MDEGEREASYNVQFDDSLLSFELGGGNLEKKKITVLKGSISTKPRRITTRLHETRKDQRTSQISQSAIANFINSF
jgi:hypothetical protein